jgi:OOP family OmpA-OmpF porin
MRPAAFLFGVIALGATGAGAWELAREGARRFEAATGAEMSAALADAGQGWTRAEIDGLRVVLTGAAPDEAARVRVLGVARALVDARRIEDQMTIRAADPVAPPDFSLEILRDDTRVSLIGLVPESGGRAAIRAGLDAAGLGDTISDMLQTAAQPMPPGWTDSLALGLRALREAPRAKVSVSPGHVGVAAAVESEAARRDLESRLRAARPRSVVLTLEITAPRPVIAPFTVDFVSDGTSGHFDSCSAESVADVVEMSVAARHLGLAADPDCAIGLGAPTPDWARAVARGLEALRALGGGRFAIRDVDATLTAPAGVDPAQLTEIGAALDRDLPEVFSLSTVAPPRMETTADGARVYAPRFDAELTGEGALTLGGALQNATSREAVEAYAAARVGHDRVLNTTVIDPTLPDGWPGRVLVGVAALSELREGTLEITPDRVLLRGTGADVETNARVEALLAEKLGRGGAAADLALEPPPAPAPAPVAATPPVAAPPMEDPAEKSAHCAEDATAILAAGQILFAPGSAEIDPESEGTIQAIADVLRACPRGAFEVGGHTDSQGAADTNLALSERRAEAVVAALRADAPGSLTLDARGYGAEQPIADNGTSDGRARNRRITFEVAAAKTPATAPDPSAAPEAGAATTSAATGEPEGEVAPLPEEGTGDEVLE